MHINVYYVLGSIVVVFGHRFKITGADIAVYRYMEANPEKFSPNALISMRGHMVRQGLLSEEIKDRAEFELRHQSCPQHINDV